MTQQEVARLGRRVAQRRRILGIGLRELAERAHVDHTWLSRLERGEYRNPDLTRVSRVFDALTLRPTWQVARDLGPKLPEMRTYFRAKYGLTPEQVDQVERYVRRLRSRH